MSSNLTNSSTNYQTLKAFEKSKAFFFPQNYTHLSRFTYKCSIRVPYEWYNQNTKQWLTTSITKKPRLLEGKEAKIYIRITQHQEHAYIETGLYLNSAQVDSNEAIPLII